MIRPTEAATDTMARLVEQSQGILAVIAATYDTEAKQHNASAEHIQAALWAVSDATEEMGAALDKLITERGAK